MHTLKGDFEQILSAKNKQIFLKICLILMRTALPQTNLHFYIKEARNLHSSSFHKPAQP
jgi:hypothetical protein